MIALALVCLALAGTLVVQQVLHNRVVQSLLTRIQTPELAPTLAPQPDVEPPEWVSPEDDKSFEAALRERNGSP